MPYNATFEPIWMLVLLDCWRRRRARASAPADQPTSAAGGGRKRLTVVPPKLLERRPALPASMSPFRDVSMLRALSHTPGDLAVGAANPASVASLLQDRGDALLRRAAQLKAHARSSKVRSTVRQAKQEWLITRTKLRDEESKLQAELARTF